MRKVDAGDASVGRFAPISNGLPVGNPGAGVSVQFEVNRAALPFTPVGEQSPFAQVDALPVAEPAAAGYLPAIATNSEHGRKHVGRPVKA
ncbi:hypothetical protein [Nevskia sp.]|uniref:hypothetical protein n=1 Tax=Nevskia sp. TaxID=1929292 RepID=UPI002600CE87|nr:hypothetical protein [Nevskia sp.]